ncbi:PREDICTED: cellulose synthase-like protein H1 isoform X2 [Lupinus angustifolius]|uniref:cellulose synthase-like protein H1 isoform X2 n=1 Tax=Lupinus angustifolius TaxID=3871 RepID=UPI00092F275C|nr:PREDICTED: cellulose synthase-like protein H1 isoform X2 [Lupinus angustifolius]
MSNQNSLPLYEKCWYKHNFKRVMDVLILFLLLLLLCYRVISINNYSIPWFVALVCESWFTFSWIFIFTTQWTPAIVKTYPDRLLQSVQELPRVDLFVTTADDVLEPPIITVNTVLSLLALDYPAQKLACYVSDDGCSPLTFYALQQASHFAKFWIPFCNKYHVQIRAPFRYFCEEHEASSYQNSTPKFREEWLWMKEKYDNLCRKIEEASRKSIPWQPDGEFAVFSNTDRKNHPTIIRVIWDKKEGLSNGLPHLIYISREKRPNHPHHFKAGAMNVLTRVSGLMTNAPFMLNVDCDMYVNNPNIVQHAMCILLDSIGEKEVAFAQCPQQFYGGLKDDPFGNQMVVMFKYIGAGLAGLQGPFYGGTNCFHRRKVIYGLYPYNIEKADLAGNIISEKELKQKFGGSDELVKSVADALEGRNYSPHDDINVSNALEAASQVASCGYEYATGWGQQVGWIYGSITEDVQTGLTIHRKGWRSEMCTPNPTGFTGSAPIGLPTAMTQQKRWTTGMVEIFFSRHSPIIATLFGNLPFRMFLAYMWIIDWGLRSLPETCYVSLLTYCIITNSNFLPKGSGLWIHVTIFIIQMVCALSEYLATGLSIRAWWNNQRMSRIRATTAGFLGFLSALFKLLRISDTVFDITRKDENPFGNGIHDSDAGRFTFNESPVFVPATTILLLQLIALSIKLLGLQPIKSGNNECGIGEMLCSAYLIICYWPFLRGLFQRGKYGIPLPTICKSASLAFLFVHLCKWTIVS